MVGSTGRFQIVHVILLCIPVLMMASHNLLQNFVAVVPQHFCSAHMNLSQTRLSPEERLLITVPINQGGKPQRCQRYSTPQWDLLTKNGTSSSWDSEDNLDVSLQGCEDGWTYNLTERSSTIISDVGKFDLSLFTCIYVDVSPCSVKLSFCLFSSFVASGIWCVIYALWSKWDRLSTWEVFLLEPLSLEVFQTSKADVFLNMNKCDMGKHPSSACSIIKNPI